jgi:hypothetical protein
MFRSKLISKPRWSKGERIRVRTREELEAGLDSLNKRNQCLMTEQMWDYCGQHFEVMKVVNHLFDERKNKLYQPHSPLYILDNLICHGRTDIFQHRCDRSCYMLWHEDWLENDQYRREVLGCDIRTVPVSGSVMCQLLDLNNNIGAISLLNFSFI